ncbi:MAG: hydantoinase/oxoprolinase family protein [Pseudomonadota bacterium]
MTTLIATDTGGTFTDIAVYDIATHRMRYGKTLTNYSNLAQGALDALAATDAQLPSASLFKHGTTQVINALIERKGSRTALVTTAGFRDLLEIGRGNRPVPFALDYRREAPLVPRSRRFELPERIGADGEVIVPLDMEAIEALALELAESGIEAVGVAFLNAYANPEHEQRVTELLRRRLPEAYVCAATELTREWSEFERISTAAANAYVGKKMEGYLRGFDAQLRAQGFDGTLAMMGSNGGVLSLERSVAQPVALVESGPIGGCIGAAAYARALGLLNVIAFDMGGTTAKCALVRGGEYDVQPIYYVGGYEHGFPLKTPVLDIVEVGAGGGSIAGVDAQGRLRVGPQSAGSEPGPVAFGRGGLEPTVTDANLALGRIGTGSFLRGQLKLDADASRCAIAERICRPLGFAGNAADVDRAAQGVLDLAVATMASAIKEVTLERGLDVRGFALMVFGGGGPLFGSILARQLGIKEVVVPPHPGNFSTIGMLLAGARIDLAQTVPVTLDTAGLQKVEAAFTTLVEEARVQMHEHDANGALSFDRALDMRYRGQKHAVRVSCPGPLDAQALHNSFTEVYISRFGQANPQCEVEVLGVRLGARAEVPSPEMAALITLPQAGTLPQPKGSRRVVFGAQAVQAPVWPREALPAGFQLTGPAIIEEYSSTTVLLPGDRATVGVFGELMIRPADEGAL